MTAADAGGTCSGPGITDPNTGAFDPATAFASGVSPYAITYTITGSCGDVDVFNIVVDQSFDATITNNPGSVCENGAAVDFDGVDPNGVWSGTGNPDAVTGVFDPAAQGPGSYTIIYTLTGACRDANTGTIVVNPTPAAPTGVYAAACPGGTSPSLSTIGGGTFTWYDNAAGTPPSVGTGSGFTPSDSNSGTYTYYVSETLGTCEGSLTAVKLTISGLTAAFTANPVSGQIPLDVDFTNNSTGATAYVWDFGDGTATDVTFEPSHTYSDFGLLTVTLAVTGAAGCTDVATLAIDVTAESDVSIPNIFSPNNDNVNDMFKPQAANLKNLHGEIFNRWGQKLFEWEGTEGGWDGHTSSGEVAPSGTCFYIITAVGADDTPCGFKGHVALAR